MASQRAWIYAGLGAAALAAVGLVEILSGPTLRSGDRILLIGDSLAVGLSTPLRALAKDHNVPFQALGVVGTRIDQWAKSEPLRLLLETFKPTIVLVSLGTNDAYMRPPPDVGVRQAPFLDELLKKIEAVGPRAIVWIMPPKLPVAALSLPSVRALIETAKQALGKPRIALFPSERLTIPRGPDEIHPVVSGYAAWAGALWQWLS